ncbi:hemin ABC transporter substrate-binding protein [Kangiella sp. HZ709]|uniref:heme/hemin ABC transporter substrate-binding protein n=1 Tax=Kangiella sp. HZ709 TaxID=2666328 RepID=UPI0018A20765|nr:ABC transporter substrate-binding protein [Kangiella sp. HZ709]
MFRLKIVLALSLFVSTVVAEESKNHVKRVISAGGALTEIVYALDAGNEVVAVDVSSMYPYEELNKLPKVGYYRQLSAEGLLSLKPTTLVAAKGAGPDVVLQQLVEAGVQVKLFEQYGYSLDAWQKLVMDIAKFFERTDFAKNFMKEKLAAIKTSQENRKYAQNTINAVLLMSAGQRGVMVAGENTMPNLLFELSGLNNVALTIDGYKTMTNEGLVQANIDMIVMPAHVVKSSGGKDAICENPTIILSLKGECNLYVMDPLLALGMGSRIDLAVKELTEYANQINL